jgi:hypothetical protein
LPEAARSPSPPAPTLTRQRKCESKQKLKPARRQFYIVTGLPSICPSRMHRRARWWRPPLLIGLSGPPSLETVRVLVPGGILGVIEYVRDEASSAAARAVVQFLAQYGEDRADARPDYVAEISALDGFGQLEAFQHYNIPVKSRAIRRSGAFIVSRAPSSRKARPSWSRHYS